MTRLEESGARIEIPRREIARYLGYRGVRPDAASAAQIEDCVRRLQSACRPRAVWGCCPLEITDLPSSNEPSAHSADDSPAAPSQETSAGTVLPAARFRIRSMTFTSRALARALRGCHLVVLMAATIGPGADFLIRRAEAVSMAEAAVFQAAGAAMAEAWCDEVNRRIAADMREQGLYARPRFSPGYGDVPLVLQRDFEALLHLPVSCGISLTDSLLMVPSKSVTAFIGLSAREEPCAPAGCEVCGHRSVCSFSR